MSHDSRASARSERSKKHALQRSSAQYAVGDISNTRYVVALLCPKLGDAPRDRATSSASLQT